MIKRCSLFFPTLALYWCCLVMAEPSNDEMANTVWDAIKVFEGDSEDVITGDFDCQGMSIGVAQWNIGKSFSGVKEIILSVPEAQISQLMPIYGSSLKKAISEGKETTLSFVRSLQTIENPNSCDAKTRNADWNAEGSKFVEELSKVLATPQSVTTQRKLRSDVFNNGLSNANLWAKSIRNKYATPTPKEIAYFVDMQNFNGGGLSKFGLSYQALTPERRDMCVSDVISYLSTADDSYLLHKEAARKNSKLLKPNSLNDSEKDLFCFSYLVAKKLKANYSRQFRLTTINRRSAILFGEAYYSDRDRMPKRIYFHSEQ